MQINKRLADCGMHHVIEKLAIRRIGMLDIGIERDAYSLLTHEERATLERVEGKAKALKGVKSQFELMEFDRLVVLIGRMTGESIDWLRRLSLTRLRGMMDGLEN
jgi:hypothetical protein